MAKKKDTTTPNPTPNPTPNLTIATLLKPTNGKVSDRKVWSIGLNGVWLPFFTATNTTGESNFPADVLGAPLRLAREKDGTPRFNQSGRPVLRVVKELSDQIRIVRENFAYGLLAYANAVAKAMPEEYKAQVAAYQKAGAPLIQKDKETLMAYLEALKAQEAPPAPTAPVDTDTIVAEAEAVATEATEKELVPA